MKSRASASREEALQRALRFLGYRSRSEMEVLSYLLRQGSSPAVARQTLEKLRASSYVDDEQFAKNWARARFASRAHGPKKIARELETKGVSQGLIRAALREAVDQDEELKKARRLLDKRFNEKKFDDAKTLHRAAAFLQRQGYSGKVIYDLLKVPTEDD